MACFEAQVQTLIETVDKLVEKNKWLEGEVLKSQEEILFLKKSKHEMDVKLDDNVKEMRALQSTESLPSYSKNQMETAGNNELTSMKQDIQDIQDEIKDLKKDGRSRSSSLDSEEELASIKGDVQDVQDEIKDLKNDVNKLTRSIEPGETKQLSRKLVGVTRKVNNLTLDLTKGMERLDMTDEKVKRLQRVFNRLHAAGQSKKDLGEEVEDIRYNVIQLTSSVQQLQQQQRLQAIPTQRSSSPMPSRKEVTASTPLTQQQLQDIRKKSLFNVYAPTIPRLQTGSAIRMEGYTGVRHNSIYMDKQSGVYRTPTKGQYKFGGEMEQEGSGKLELYVCEEGTTRRELVGKTEKEGFGSGCNGDVYWDCREDVGVWVEVIRVKGKAGIWSCCFSGELM